MNIEMQILDNLVTCKCWSEWKLCNANCQRPNHNMDPNIVNSASFGLLWKVPFNTKEQVGRFHRIELHDSYIRAVAKHWSQYEDYVRYQILASWTERGETREAEDWNQNLLLLSSWRRLGINFSIISLKHMIYRRHLVVLWAKTSISQRLDFFDDD